MSDQIGVTVVPPLHRPWDPDECFDFHAARLLILLRRCGEGSRGQIKGRTKLAKLDFFIRYPAFLEVARNSLALVDPERSDWHASGSEVEAPMIRYRYGPWDPRYRQFLAFLEARELVSITAAKIESVSLTPAGRRLAETFAQRPSFEAIVDRCDAMVGNLASLGGMQLKELIYELFPDEVGGLAMRAEIRS